MILSVGESNVRLTLLKAREHANAGRNQLLQRVRRFDRFTTETRFLGHDEDPNGGRGFSAAMSRTKPGRIANSAPDIPSSTKVQPSSTLQPLRSAQVRA
jgi:hypothetical protein